MEPIASEAVIFQDGLLRFSERFATAPALADLGFAVSSGYETVSKRPFILVENEPGSPRAWGAYLMDRSLSTRLIIEAPHPVADQNSEAIALALWQQIPGSLLMIAGAHRQAGGPGGNQGLADVPWNEDSLFNRVARYLMPLPQLQIHGYANAIVPDYDVVVSTGSAPTNSLAIDIANAIEGTGLRVARVWKDDSDVLTSKGNKQSLTALSFGTTFVHVEMNRTVRMSATLTQGVVRAVSSVARSI